MACDEAMLAELAEAWSAWDATMEGMPRRASVLYGAAQTDRLLAAESAVAVAVGVPSTTLHDLIAERRRRTTGRLSVPAAVRDAVADAAAGSAISGGEGQYDPGP